MPDKSELSEARRALLEKYLRGDTPQAAIAVGVNAQHAEAEVASSRERAVVVQAGEGSKRLFFFLHGHWKGSAFYCFPLAHDLGSDQPFCALDPYRLDDLQIAPPIETIAAAHIRSLRAIQPEGPYFLGGFCNGALVAYEVARQLHAEGQTVDLLVLMDPMAFSSACPVYQRLLRGVISRFGGLMRLGPDKQLDWFVRLRHILRTVYSHLQDLHRRSLKDSERVGSDEQIEPVNRRNKAGFALPRLASLILTDEALHQDYMGVFDWLALGYRPTSVYSGKITFFWPSETLWHSRWWQEVAEATEVEVHVIPGTQNTWKTEHLHALAERLRVCLSKVQKEVT